MARCTCRPRREQRTCRDQGKPRDRIGAGAATTRRLAASSDRASTRDSENCSRSAAGQPDPGCSTEARGRSAGRTHRIGSTHPTPAESRTSVARTRSRPRGVGQDEKRDRRVDGVTQTQSRSRRRLASLVRAVWPRRQRGGAERRHRAADPQSDQGPRPSRSSDGAVRQQARDRRTHPQEFSQVGTDERRSDPHVG